MSSGFVSGGTIDNPTERDDAWRDAQRELEEKRRAKEEGMHANDGGKSLYEALQANKGSSSPISNSHSCCRYLSYRLPPRYYPTRIAAQSYIIIRIHPPGRSPANIELTFAC